MERDLGLGAMGREQEVDQNIVFLGEMKKQNVSDTVEFYLQCQQREGRL